MAFFAALWIGRGWRSEKTWLDDLGHYLGSPNQILPALKLLLLSAVEPVILLVSLKNNNDAATMIDFEIPDETKLVRAQVHEFVQSVCIPAEQNLNVDTFDYILA